MGQKFLGLFAFIFITTLVHAAELSESEVRAIHHRQLADLETVLIELDTHYGLVRKKKRDLGITIDSVREKYKRLILEAITKSEDEGAEARKARQVLNRQEFQQLLIGLAREFEDGHFNILRMSKSSDIWTVGMYTADIDGRLYVTDFDDKYFVGGSTRIKVEAGHEIVEINGVPVEQVARTLLPSISMATHNSRLIYAYKMILNRPHTWLPGVKEGDEVKIKFRKENPKYKKTDDKDDDKKEADASNEKPFIEYEGIFHWVNKKVYNQRARFFPEPLPAENPDKEKFIFGTSYVQTYFSEGLKKVDDAKDTIIDLGAILNTEIAHAKAAAKDKKIAMDEKALALKKLEAMKDLKAYTYRYKGKTFGVLRIPDYGFFDDGVRWLREVVSRMEKLVDVLVIDQLDNGGGYVFSFTQFLRLFAHDKDFKLETIDMRLSETLLQALDAWSREQRSDDVKPKNHFTAHDEDEKSADKEKDDLFPKPNFASLILAENQLKELREKYDRGEQWSGPLPYFSSVPRYKEGEFGVVVANPDYIFTKPILVLNDGRSGSGGDFFPSAMQVNKRALIWGSTSMGLGAPVYFGTYPITSVELYMRCPFGECLRPDGLSLEGLGTVPDLVRWPKISDFKDGFKDLATDVLDTALQLAEGKSHEEIKKLRADAHLKKMPTTENFKKVKAIIDELESKLGEDATIDSIVPAYQNAFAKLTALGDDSAIGEQEWEFLIIPLPKALLKNDLFLSSLRRTDEMSDRLKILPRLEFFKAHPEWNPVLDFLSKNLGSLGKARKDVCYDHLAQFTKPY